MKLFNLDFYGQSFYSQYPNVSQPFSPQQSSTSDVEEVSSSNRSAA